MSPLSRFVGREPDVSAVLERLRTGVSTVIVGEAGIGKTALAREVARRLRDENQSPLIVAGADWTGAGLPRSILEAVEAATTVVILDDAHLLDPVPTQALGHLLVETHVRIIATVRSGDRPVRSLAWLWAVGPCERLALGPLGSDDTRALVEQQLGGPADDSLVTHLQQRTGGNPLLIGHLTFAGTQSGALTRVRGVWQLTGTLPLTTAAADIVRDVVADLTPAQEQALQMIALAQPLRLTVAENLSGRADLEALESRQLIAASTDSVEPTLSCAHPLFAEVLRGDLGLLRSRRLRATLLQAMGTDAAGPAASIPQQERLLAMSWRVDLGEPTDGAELIDCVRYAVTAQPALAEQLLRHLLAGDPDGPFALEAADRLAHLLFIQGRIAEADQVAAGAEQRQFVRESAELRESLDSVRVLVRTRLGEIAQALRLLGADPDAVDASEAGVVGDLGPGSAVDLRTQALYAQLSLLSARLDETLRIAEPLVASPIGSDADSDEATRPVARGIGAYVEVAAYSFTGRISDTSAALQRNVPVLAATREQLPYGMAMAQVSTAIGQVLAGNLAAAARLGQRMSEIARQDEDPWQRPRAATVLGLVALYRGQARTAVEHLRTALAALSPLDTMFVRYNLAFLARAAALAGNITEAERALRPPQDAPRFPLYEPDWQIAEAAVLAGRFRLGDAARQAMTAARLAADQGQWAIAAVAAHDAARYADLPDAARLLTTAADLVDGPLAALMRDHAVARSHRDPARLLAVSEELDRVGATLFAAEAAYASVRCLHRAGDRSAAQRLAAHSIELHNRCEHAFLPWALGGAATGLTNRERHIALLAASGHTDHDISGELAISIRTVQTHLTRVYTKLDITGRGAIAAALTDIGPRAVRHSV